MPDDRDLPGDETMRADIAGEPLGGGEPLTASVRDILDEHAETARRADEEQRAEEAEQERLARRKDEQAEVALRHTGGERRLRPRRDERLRAPEDGGAAQLDPRVLAGAVLLGVVLAGGMRRLVLLGALGAGAWALYQRVLAPARDPGAVLQ